jgi:hypothetical protein
MYGTVEYGHPFFALITSSATQFTSQRLKLFTNDIFDVLEIIILEQEEIKENNFLVYGK